jgi:hypothetical protein
MNGTFCSILITSMLDSVLQRRPGLGVLAEIIHEKDGKGESKQCQIEEWKHSREK